MSMAYIHSFIVCTYKFRKFDCPHTSFVKVYSKGYTSVIGNRVINLNLIPFTLQVKKSESSV